MGYDCFLYHPCMYAVVHVRARVVLKRTAPAEHQKAQRLRGSGVHFITDVLAHSLHVFMSFFQKEWSLCCMISALHVEHFFIILWVVLLWEQESDRPCDSDMVVLSLFRLHPPFPSTTLSWKQRFVCKDNGITDEILKIYHKIKWFQPSFK